MNHWGMFKQAWSITWRHPALWFFALLPLLVSFGLTLLAQIGSPVEASLSDDPERMLRILRQAFSASGTTLLIGVIIQLVAAIVAAFAEGAMIGMVNGIASGQKAGIGAGLAAASPRLTALVIAHLLLNLPLVIVGALVGASVLSLFPALTSNPEEALGAFAGSFAGWSGVLLVLGLLVGGLLIGADRAIVLDNLPPLPAIARGWRLLWSKFADYFTIGLIFFVLLLLVSVVFVCVLAPILFGALVGSLGTLRPGVNVFVGALGPQFLIVQLLFAFIGVISSVFVSSVWTLAYRRWQASAPTVAN